MKCASDAQCTMLASGILSKRLGICKTIEEPKNHDTSFSAIASSLLCLRHGRISELKSSVAIMIHLRQKKRKKKRKETPFRSLYRHSRTNFNTRVDVSRVRNKSYKRNAIQSLNHARFFSSFFNLVFSLKALTSFFVSFFACRSAFKLLPSWQLAAASTSK